MRLAAISCLLFSWTVCSAETLVYIGTYTRGDSSSEGIYVSTLDQTSGELSAPKLAAKAFNPSFVAIHPNGKTLYAVSEAPETGDGSVGVIAFSILDDGTLNQLNERSTGGAGACHVSVDPTGQCVGVANYGGGSCASFPINDDGSLGEIGSFRQHVGNSVNPRRQKEPHAHSFNFSADSSQAFVADLGTDEIVIYDVDPKLGKITPSKQGSLKMPAGGGPRHFCLMPSGNAALSNLEMTSQVAFLRYAPSAKNLAAKNLAAKNLAAKNLAAKNLAAKNLAAKTPAAKTLSLGSVVSSLPGGSTVRNNSTAECLVHPNGKSAYVSNRGHHSIAMFRIDEVTGDITACGHQSTLGETPRGFGIDSGGNFLVVANQKSGNIVSLKIDPDTGLLTPTGSEIKVGMPVNVRCLTR
jgi:6-phosphogluconolactonase